MTRKRGTSVSPKARETWGQAIAFSLERGLIGPAMWQRGERLRCLYHAGEWDAALTEAAEVLAWELEPSAGPLEVYARLPLAGIHVHRGDVDAAEAQVAALVPAARRSGDPQVVVPGLSVAALVASAAGNVEAAVARLDELEVVTRGQPAWRSFCRVEPLRIAVSLGRPDLGEVFLGDSRVGPGWDACAVTTAAAILREARGDRRRPPAGIGRQRNAGGAYGSVLERGYALLGLGRCGDAGAAARGGEDLPRDRRASSSRRAA